MIIIILLTALTTFLLIIVAYKLVSKKEQVVSARIDKYVQPSIPKNVTKAITGWMNVVRYLSPFFTPFSKARYFDNKLIQAGIPLRGSEFLALTILIAVAIGAFCLIVTKGSLLVSIGIAFLTYMLAHVYLKIKIAQRLSAFNQQLGDTLSLMANTLRSGNSFLQTADMVSREMTPPISVEFSRMLKEMNLGAPTETALNNLLQRVRSEDLDLVVTAILIQRQIGGNLAEILDNIATTIQDRYMMKKEIRTLTAQGRISGWIIGLLPIVVAGMIGVINPDYIQLLFTAPLGKILIGYGMFSLLIGIMFVRRIVDIDM
ncbi:MAG: Type secretion system domain protein [Firmicutes bacterium]|nr:Type secretion system domain protein [Bacillota bacterium]